MSEWIRNLRTLRCYWKMPLLWGVLGVVLSVVLCSPPAGATTVLEKTFSALVQDAEVIVVGTVTAIEAEWNAEKEAPFTLVTFSDLEVLKGDESQTEITLHFLGGPTPDGLIMQIAGVPQFTPGERYVIFCVGNQYQAVPLVGMWQGMYRVVFDAGRGMDTIHNHAGQPVTTLPTGEGGILHDEAPIVQGQKDQPSEAMPLDTFTQMIERELHNGQ